MFWTYTTHSEANEKAEHFYDEAKATAGKVGEYISKEAEELEDRAKEAQKRYVPRSRMPLLSWTWTYHALFQSVCQCELWHEEVPGWLERLLEQPQVLAHHA